MKHKKHTGSYYTPDYLSAFMINYVSNHFNDQKSLSVFEPSVGDGSFVRSFNNAIFPESIRSFSFTGIDKIKPELDKAEEESLIMRRRNTKYNFTKKDFLHYQKNINRKFHLIAGNPPYIKKNLLNKTQIQLCTEIHKSGNLSETSIKNIWSAFLVRCSQILNKDGVLAFVLPAELLQVKFSSELRTFLTKEFERVEIFTFDDLLFECKGQDTILLFAFKQHVNKGQFYAHIANTEQLATGDFRLVQNQALVSTEIKWTHHQFAADDLTFIHNIGKRLQNVEHYCDSKPGIVTAANSFFIVDEETKNQYGLADYTKPIIQKGLFVNGSVVFTRKNFEKLVEEGKPTSVLVFDDSDANNLPEIIEKYLTIGEELELPDRYKCAKRKNWFVIPNISTVPQGFFFKRSHNYPKILKNNADTLVTDSAYKIEMRSGFEINHLIYSFYNSLTLTFAELNGRYYGGGVLELTPQEFKKLPIPNIAITPRDFNNYANAFNNKNDITDILNANDNRILAESLNLNIEEIERVKNIYKRLIDKRLRNKNS